MPLPNGGTALPDAAAQIRRAKGVYGWLWRSPLLTIPTLGFLLISGYNIAFSAHRSAITTSIDVTATPIPDVTATAGPDVAFSAYSSADDYQRNYLVVVGVAVLGSGLWHLVLLTRALDRQSEFVRWHGRQALMLAGARTAVVLALAVQLATGSGGQSSIFLVLILLALWFFGTPWGQRQAARGECSLMRWAGHGDHLPLRVAKGAPAAAPAALSLEGAGPQALYDRGLELQYQGDYAEAAQLFRQLLVSDAPPAVKAQAADQMPPPGQLASVETADILVAMLRFGLNPARRSAALAALEQAGLVETL